MDDMIDQVVKFVKARDWEQFHNPKDVAISLALEAAEVLEHFQWKNPEEIKMHLKANKQDVSDEIADVLYWVLLMSYYLEIDLHQAFASKMQQNEKKYPADKAKGSHSKYTAYQDE
jgi:NTP pyrophosphatase (non-canonical NTP hydrolase)